MRASVFVSVRSNAGHAPTLIKRQVRRGPVTLGTILLIVLVLMLIGAIPNWSHSRSWGYGPVVAWDWCWSSSSSCF
jgi:uncharacterized protein DUF3309